MVFTENGDGKIVGSRDLYALWRYSFDGNIDRRCVYSYVCHCEGDRRVQLDGVHKV